MMIFTIFFWLLAWVLGGCPDVEPWNGWFIFLIVCTVATAAAAHAQHGVKLIPVPVPVPSEESDELDDE